MAGLSNAKAPGPEQAGLKSAEEKKRAAKTERLSNAEALRIAAGLKRNGMEILLAPEPGRVIYSEPGDGEGFFIIDVRRILT